MYDSRKAAKLVTVEVLIDFIRQEQMSLFDKCGGGLENLSESDGRKFSENAKLIGILQQKAPLALSRMLE